MGIWMGEGVPENRAHETQKYNRTSEWMPEEEKVMSKRFFGFALADSMFAGDSCTIKRQTVSVDAVRELVEMGVESCLNPSHVATINAMKARFGIAVAIPETPPRVSLGLGDSIIVMGVRGLPRLTDRHEYTEAEIAVATFGFTVYTVIA